MSAPSLIAIVNQSTLVSNDDVATIARASATWLRYHVAPAWNISSPAVVYYADPATIPPGAHRIAIVDKDPSGEAGVLGWHTEDQQGIYGIAAAEPVLTSGYKTLEGDWSLSSVVMHEIGEMACDQSCRGWEMADDGYLYAREIGDPVEGQTFRIRPSGGPYVAACNFVTPAWFDNDAHGPYDYLGLLKQPFTWLKTGYVIRMKSGQEEQQFGDELPVWRRAMKTNNPYSRTNRRLSQTPTV